MAISPQGVIQSTSCLVLGWGRHLGKFKWRYLRNRSSNSLRVWF